MAIKKTASRKLDLFKFLKDLSLKKKDCYMSLPDDEKKEVSPYVIARFLSGTNDMRQVYFLNEIVNPYTFSLQKHKELLTMLMTICTPGRVVRYNWLKQAKKTSTTPKLNGLVREYFGYNSSDAGDAIPLLSNEDLLSYAEQLGYQKQDIAIIKKELKKRATI